ncbi:antibiotic biosynthesis monooxygenase [bacterium SCSIO 12696]|nr:antibiotic biosynthesis monooxygenase [bacterium SCSIO 12696]
MPKIILQGHIVVPETDLPEVEAELPRHIELTKAEKGCLDFQVTQSLENKRIFTVYEEFIDRAAFEYHQQRVKKSYWGTMAVNVERHYRISEIDCPEAQ